MGLRTVRLDPVDKEKEELLARYMGEWRHTYAAAATITRRIDSCITRQARLWYRVHQYHCDHTPRCKNIGDYWRVYRSPKLAEARRRLLKGRTIHSIAFGQAWFKGFSNRAWSPEAYRQMALIPKALIRREGSLLLLRLYPRLELAFETPEQVDAQGAKAVRLVRRWTDRGRIPKGWSLLV